MLAKTILELSVHKTLKMLWRTANDSSYIIRLQHNATLDTTLICNTQQYNYTARNAQVAASLLQACCLAVIKPISGYVRIACLPVLMIS